MAHLNGIPRAPVSETTQADSALRAAASELLLRYQFARQHGISFGGLRDLYEIFGYSRELTTRDYRDRYARGGIAKRIVEVYPNATWRGTVEIIEDENPETFTPFEQAWDDLDTKHQLQAKLRRVDILSCLSTYAVLLIGAPGELDQELPKGRPDQLLFFRPMLGGGGYPASVSSRAMAIDAPVTIHTWETDTKNPRFGLPRMYQIRLNEGIPTDIGQKPVHWSRVIHIAEGCLEDDVFGIPALEAVWNLLDDLDKVTGGGAEAFWLRANQGLHLDIAKDMALADAKESAEQLREQAENYKHQMTRWLRTRGVQVNTLGSDVANFMGPADAIITQIAGTKGIPKRILTGSEMGELASSQDRENWRDQVVGRQTSFAGPYIVRPLIDRLIQYGYLPVPAKGVRGYEVKWPNISILTEQERRDGAQAWAGTATPEGQVFTNAEIRDKWYEREPLTPEEQAKLRPAPAPTPAAFPIAAEAKHSGILVSLPVPEHVGKQIVVPGGEAPHNLHVTLCYIKSTTDQQKVRDVVENAIGNTSSLTFDIMGVGRFPASSSSDGRDVVYAKVHSPRLLELREKIYDALVAADMPPKNDFEYTPHITLRYVDPKDTTEFTVPVILGVQPWSVEIKKGDESMALSFAYPIFAEMARVLEDAIEANNVDVMKHMLGMS